MAKKPAERILCQDAPPFADWLDEESEIQHQNLGVHRNAESALSVYTFRVWAPRADAVHLVGDFVTWEKGRPMTALSGGIWVYHLTTETSLEGQKYKFKIFSRGKATYQADPFAKQLESGGNAASIVHTSDSFRFGDAVWMKKRKKKTFSQLPLHLYEIDPASWRTHDSRPVCESFSVLGYRELADRLTPYVKGLGYTHITLLRDGMKDGGLFSPSPRFGTPEDFRYFVNKMHTNGVGVLYPFSLADAVSHFFSQDTEESCSGLLLEKTVAQTLLSSLFFFAQSYHIDGFVLDLGTKSESASEFFSLCAKKLKAAHPDLLLIAKGDGAENTAGVDLVWDSGKEQMLTRYLACDPYFRSHHHAALSLPHESEAATSLLPQSQGESRSLMAGYFGTYEEKFATNRLYSAYRLFYPARLASFMGNELSPFSARDPERELEWFMLDFPMHERFFEFTKKINGFYLANPALWELDSCPEGVTTLYENACDNVVALLRRDRQNNSLIGIFNFSAVLLTDYTLEIPDGRYREMFNTDAIAYGGSGQLNAREKTTKNGKITLDIPPLSAVIIQPVASAADRDIKDKKIKIKNRG